MWEAAESRLTQLHEGTPGLAWRRDRAVRRKSTSRASATGPVKTPIRPLLPQQRRNVARWGLAMDNLKSDWGFSASLLILAETSDHFALRICAVDLKNSPFAAEALTNIKKCLDGAKTSVEVADIKVQPLRDGAKSTLQDIFVVAKLLPKAPKMLQLVCDGPPEAHRLLFDLEEIGGIPPKVPTRHGPRWRSSLSTERRSPRWSLSALHCVSLRRMVLRGPCTCSIRCSSRLWWHASTFKWLTRRRRWQYTKKQRRPTQHLVRLSASVRTPPSLRRRHTYQLLRKCG